MFPRLPGELTTVLGSLLASVLFFLVVCGLVHLVRIDYNQVPYVSPRHSFTLLDRLVYLPVVQPHTCRSVSHPWGPASVFFLLYPISPDHPATSQDPTTYHVLRIQPFGSICILNSTDFSSVVFDICCFHVHSHTSLLCLALLIFETLGPELTPFLIF